MGTSGRDGRWDQFRAAGHDTGGQDAGSVDAAGRDAGRRGPRWLVPLRVVVVLLAMAAAALGMLWVESAGVRGATDQVDAGRPVAVPPLTTQTTPDAPPAGPAADVPVSASASPDPATGGVLVVHVAGAVTAPGVFLLPAGSRVFEAVEKAGGALPTAELAAVNLAAELADGTQIFLPTAEQAAAQGAGPGSGQQPGPAAGGGAGGAPGAPAAGPAQPLNLNAASAGQLEELPGLGPVLAQRIVQWRTDHGPFATVDGLQAVPGIGTKLLAGLRELVVAP